MHDIFWENLSEGSPQNYIGECPLYWRVVHIIIRGCPTYLIGGCPKYNYRRMTNVLDRRMSKVQSRSRSTISEYVHNIRSVVHNIRSVVHKLNIDLLGNKFSYMANACVRESVRTRGMERECGHSSRIMISLECVYSPLHEHLGGE